MTETFNETGTAPAGQKVYLVGSPAALAAWNTDNAVPLSSSDGTHWSTAINLPAGASFEYKYIVKDAAGNVTWEPTANHSATTSTSAGMLSDVWGQQSSSGSGSNQLAVTFHEAKAAPSNQAVYVVGSIPTLGTWNTQSAIALTSPDHTNWTATINLPPNTSFEYKYVLKDAGGNVTWESGANRTAGSGASGTTLNDTWK